LCVIVAAAASAAAASAAAAVKSCCCRSYIWQLAAAFSCTFATFALQQPVPLFPDP